jgi:hypothetical protein
MGSRKSKGHLDSYVTVGLNKDDIEQLRRATSKSTCRTLSEYCRKLLLGKPIRVLYRDQSLDAFIDEAIALRNEMRALREKGPFTPERERQLITLQEEIKKCINKIFDHACQNKNKQRNS